MRIEAERFWRFDRSVFRRNARRFLWLSASHRFDGARNLSWILRSLVLRTLDRGAKSIRGEIWEGVARACPGARMRRASVREGNEQGPNHFGPCRVRFDASSAGSITPWSKRPIPGSVPRRVLRIDLWRLRLPSRERRSR